jgi:hypothetical protein
MKLQNINHASLFNPTFLKLKNYFKNKVENKKFKVKVVVWYL